MYHLQGQLKSALLLLEFHLPPIQHLSCGFRHLPHFWAFVSCVYEKHAVQEPLWVTVHPLNNSYNLWAQAKPLERDKVYVFVVHLIPGRTRCVGHLVRSKRREFKNMNSNIHAGGICMQRGITGLMGDYRQGKNGYESGKLFIFHPGHVQSGVCIVL